MAPAPASKGIHPHHAIAYLTSDARLVDFRCLPPLCATADSMACTYRPAGEVWGCLAPYLRRLLIDQCPDGETPVSTTQLVDGDGERGAVRLTLDPVPAESEPGPSFLACWHGPGSSRSRTRWCWLVGSDSVWWAGDTGSVFGVPGGGGRVTRAHFLRIIGADDREHFRATMDRALSDRKPFNTVLRIAGSNFTIRQAGATLWMSDETPIVAGTIQPLTSGVTRHRPESCAYQTSPCPYTESDA